MNSSEEYIIPNDFIIWGIHYKYILMSKDNVAIYDSIEGN